MATASANSGRCVGPLTEVVRAAEELEEGGCWTVHSRNCLAALLALADRQPRILTLVTSTPDELAALPVVVLAALAKAARDCDVELYFEDSIRAPRHPKKDNERLDHFVNNSSLRLTSFSGHLDAAGIAKLPRSLTQLSLRISSAADARGVSNLRPWEGLRALGVSVSCGVAAQNLRPLPSGLDTYLFMRGLTDAKVASVRPVIEALVGDRGVAGLFLPACRLTAGGARRLARLMRGAVFDALIIKPRGPWRPRAEERRRLQDEFKGLAGCSLVTIEEIPS